MVLVPDVDDVVRADLHRLLRALGDGQQVVDEAFDERDLPRDAARLDGVEVHAALQVRHHQRVLLHPLRSRAGVLHVQELVDDLRQGDQEPPLVEVLGAVLRQPRTHAEAADLAESRGCQESRQATGLVGSRDTSRGGRGRVGSRDTSRGAP